MDFDESDRVRRRGTGLLDRHARPRARGSGRATWPSALPNRAAVREFFAIALREGADALHEPRVWPEYHATYYGAFVRDPDGNNVEAVCHAPEDE